MPIDQARKIVIMGDCVKLLMQLIDQYQNPERPDFYMLTDWNIKKKIMLDEIMYIQSQKDISKIICVDRPEPYWSSEHLKAIEHKVDPAILIRSHKSYIVNVGKVRAKKPAKDGGLLYFNRDCTGPSVQYSYKYPLIIRWLTQAGYLD